MESWQQRTEQLIGAAAAERLSHAHILIVGVGGVGAWAAEMLARAGVGEMTLVDADVVSLSNINRQMPALHSTVGEPKTEVARRRLLDINPSLRLHLLTQYLKEEDVPSLLDTLSTTLRQGGDVFIVDAIDTIAPKCALIVEAHRRALPIISSMGAGAKTDITQIRFAHLEDTFNCGLSKAVRTRLKKVNATLPPAERKALALLKTAVVFSTEPADLKAVIPVTGEPGKRSTTGTISYLPATFGCYIAEHIISEIAELRNKGTKELQSADSSDS